MFLLVLAECGVGEPQYSCLQVDSVDQGGYRLSAQQLSLEQLTAVRDSSNVEIEVEYSSMNYKDALAATGHPGVARNFPLVPGIDAAGKVVVSRSDRFREGDTVIVSHAKFGTKCNGGWAQRICVPDDWVYKCPESLSTRQAMTIGTAGFTAAQCVDELIRHGVHPDDGEIVVTGATGGVGIFAVKLLAKLGYSVVASTGKPEQAELLTNCGAARIESREALNDTTDAPLLKAQWAGAVDTVGGNTLATVIRAMKPQGCVTACGLVGGFDLKLTVYPFILRGVTLRGIDSANISYEHRSGLWAKIGGAWRPDDLDQVGHEFGLDQMEDAVQQILNGKIAGRVLVKV